MIDHEQGGTSPPGPGGQAGEQQTNSEPASISEPAATCQAQPTSEPPTAGAAAISGPAPVAPPGRRGRKPIQLDEELREEILRLHGQYRPRAIGKRVGLSRKLVQRVLQQHGLLSPRPRSEASLLEPFKEQIEKRARDDLTTTRTLREIRELGYQGGRTILGEQVRKLKASLTTAPRSNKTVKCRFETDPGQEMQFDWSPYTVLIGGVWVSIFVLGCILAWSRKLWFRAYRNERQSTLLQALASAFEYFDGVAARAVLDNMSTAVLGRIGPNRIVLWSQRFLDFMRHYGPDPFACLPGDPDRKGKKEKSFRLLWDDFLKGSEFESWDDLQQRLRVWLDDTPEVANQRIHGTTGRVPNQAYEQEHPFLIRLPDKRFPVFDLETREVDNDSTLWIGSTAYTVPDTLANRTVAVRLYAEHFEVLDRFHAVAFSRRYVPDSEKGRLVIDKTHYALMRRRSQGHGTDRLDDAFVRSFPTLRPLVDGIKRRMKTLAPIHLRALLRLHSRFGLDPFLCAATRAQQYKRFDALAVERILVRDYPDIADTAAAEDTITPLSGYGPVALGEVDPGSLDSYATLDAEPTTDNSLPKEHNDGSK
jgi:transposase